MVNFLISHHGLVLEKDPHELGYGLNGYLLSTDFCANLFCFDSYQMNQFIQGHYLIYMRMPNAQTTCPQDYYWTQTKYMYELLDINNISRTVIDISFKYGGFIYDNILILTYPE